MMLSFRIDVWSLFALVVATSLMAVVVTNILQSPRFLKALARSTLLLTFLLLCYQSMMTAFAVRPHPHPVVLISPSTPLPVPATGDSIVGGPSLSASFVNRVLTRAGSPAVGTGQALYDLSLKYHVDDAYALSTFQHESTYGKYGAGAVNRSLGNIVCAGYVTCNGRFRSYVSWEEGYADFYRLIAREYVTRGCTTLACIIPVYAPPSENNTPEYVQTVRMQIVRFRAGQIA